MSRDEREFIRTVCADFFLVYGTIGCSVTVYGQIVFKSIFEENSFDPWLEDQGLRVPVFRIEAIEFLGFPGK